MFNLFMAPISINRDEECDLGIRKVRSSKLSFDRPNLFQEIATKNATRKKAKLDRRSSGNIWELYGAMALPMVQIK